MSQAEKRKLALRAAVEQLNLDLDSAHHVAQEYEGYYLADILHAIVHRRDGDYGNSVYWWNRVGRKAPAELISCYPNSDPVAFVAQCRLVGRADSTVLQIEKAETGALISILK